MPAHEDADARERDEPSQPVGPHDSVLDAAARFVRNVGGCLRGRGDHPLTPAARTEVILRGVLNLLLNGQHRGDVLAEVCPHLAVGGRHRQDQVAVGPFIPIGGDPLLVPSTCVLQGRLVQVVVHHVIRRQDDEVDGTRERDAAEDVLQCSPVDRLEAPRLVVHVDRRSNEFVCRHRGPDVINEGEYQPHGNDDRHDDTQQDAPCTECRALHVARRHMSALLVRQFGRRRSHTATLTRRSGSRSAVQPLSRQENGASAYLSGRRGALASLVHVVAQVSIEIHRQQVDGRAASHQDTGSRRGPPFEVNACRVYDQSDRG